MHPGFCQQQVHRHLARNQHVRARIAHELLSVLDNPGNHVLQTTRIDVRADDIVEADAGFGNAGEALAHAPLPHLLEPEVAPRGVEEQHAGAPPI